MFGSLSFTKLTPLLHCFSLLFSTHYCQPMFESSFSSSKLFDHYEPAMNITITSHYQQFLGYLLCLLMFAVAAAVFADSSTGRWPRQLPRWLCNHPYHEAGRWTRWKWLEWMVGSYGALAHKQPSQNIPCEFTEIHHESLGFFRK